MDRGWASRNSPAPRTEPPPVGVSDTWGIWRLSRRGLEVNDGTGYGISFDRINSSEGMLWWIDHMMEKCWITPVDICDFRLAMQDIFGRNAPDGFNPEARLREIFRRKSPPELSKPSACIEYHAHHAGMVKAMGEGWEQSSG